MNNERIKSVELMKAIATIGMVLVHAIEPTFLMIAYNGGYEEYKAVPGYYIPFTLVEILGGVFSAGAFMFAMGWGAAYSDKSTPATFVKRAGILYLLGLLVNVFTGYYVRFADPVYFEIESLKDCLFVLFKVDIYFFAALGMLVFAVLKKLPNVKARAVFTVIIAAAAICTNIIFPKGTLATDNEWFNTMLTGLFTRQNAVSYFPFVSWFAFPIVGYWTAYFYRNIKDKKKFYIIVAAAAVALFAVGQGVITAKGLDPAALNPALANEDTYYGLDVWNIMSGTGLVLAELLLCFGILKLTQNRLPNFMR